jgi:hypothetical protein
LFISSSCNIGDITGIKKEDCKTDIANWLVYVSTHYEWKDLTAMVITNLTSLSSPGIVFERYVRDDISSALYRNDVKYHHAITPFSIQGSSSAGYYVSNDDYINKSSSGSTYTYSYGFAQALYVSNCINSMSDYDPSNWKRWKNAGSKFQYAYTYPSKAGKGPYSNYAYCHYPDIPITFPSAVTYCYLFSSALIDSLEGSAAPYKENGYGCNLFARYKREGTSTPYYWIRAADVT